MMYLYAKFLVIMCTDCRDIEQKTEKLGEKTSKSKGHNSIKYCFILSK